jgi:hypothetical protein
VCDNEGTSCAFMPPTNISEKLVQAVSRPMTMREVTENRKVP